MISHLSTTPFLGDLAVRRYALDNGLKLLFVQDSSSPTFSWHTYFGVGSGDEEEGRTGLAHLFEHMMFKRTDRWDDSWFSETIERAGGPDLNAWTWLDVTAYHVSMPRERLALIAELEATRMHRLLVDEESLEAEREVVLNERKYRVDNSPEGAINERLWALAFTATRYRWPTIGWEDDIRGYTVDDCRTFYRRFYGPDNATVVVVGDVDEAELLALVEEHYGAIAPVGVERREHGVEPAQESPRLLEIEESIETEMLQIGFKVPAITHEDWSVLALLDAILSAGNSSRLQRALVDSGLASSSGSFLPPFRHEALFEVSVNLREGRSAAQALEIVETEFAALASAEVSNEELERARAQLLTSSWGELVTHSGRAGFLGFNEMTAGSWQRGLERLDRYALITAADVRRVAARWLTPDRRSAVLACPRGAATAPAAKLDSPPTGVAILPEPGSPDRAPSALEPGRVQREVIGDWTRLLVHDPRVPLRWFRMLVDGGSALDPPGREGLVNLTAELLLRGTEERDRFSFEEAIDALGASVDVSVSADGIGLSGSVLADRWPQLRDLLIEALKRPRFDVEDLQDLAAEIKADIIDSRNSDRELCRVAFDARIYGEHPYARRAEGTVASVSNVSRADVVEMHARLFRRGGATVALAGLLDAHAEADAELLALALAGGAPPVRERPVVTRPPGNQVLVVDKPERSQAQILVGQPSVGWRHPDYAALWLANEAFGGGGFGARLMREVREERGWSYGAYSNWTHARDNSVHWIWVFPSADYAVECLALVQELFAAWVRDGVSDDELAYARDSILNSAAFFVDTPLKRLNYELRKARIGADPLGLMDAVRTVSLEDVRAAVSRDFDPEVTHAVIVATASDVRDQLVELMGEGAVSVVAYDTEFTPGS